MAKQYLVIHEDRSGYVEHTIMVTAMPPEVGIKALNIYRVITCEEVDDGAGSDSSGSHWPDDRASIGHSG